MLRVLSAYNGATNYIVNVTAGRGPRLVMKTGTSLIVPGDNVKLSQVKPIFWLYVVFWL